MADSNKQFDSGFNYQKLALSGSVTQNIATTTGGPPPTPVSVTITHNLNKIVPIRVWYDSGLGTKLPAVGFYNDPTRTNYITVAPYVTLNTLVLEVLNFGAAAIDVTFYYRIYSDAN